MKRLLSITALAAAAIMTASAVHAQARFDTMERFSEPARTEATHSVSLHASTLGASFDYAYEHPVSRRGTIIGRIGAHAGGAWGHNMFSGPYAYWLIQPSFDIEPRFYYGLDRRERRGRSTEGNSGSFIALRARSVLPFGYISDHDRTVGGGTAFTPMWGLRRVWSNNLMFEFTLGPTLTVGWNGGADYQHYIGLRFGYSF